MSEHYAPTRRANKVADWAETLALTRGSATGQNHLLDAGREHGFQTADVSLGLNTMRRRSALLQEAYPFRIAGGGVAPVPKAADFVWTALLLMSFQSPVRQKVDLGTTAQILERIVAISLTSLYGPGTKSVRFGWPSEEGRPPEFPKAIRWLAHRMGVSIGGSYRPPRRKDGGVDVVAWRPFPDGRSGFPVLLTQYTLEKDPAHKAGDIDLRVWAGWLALDSDPSTALAIPEVVASGEEWNALASRTIVLDRLRLASLIDPRRANDRLGPVVEWTTQAMALLGELQ